MRRRYIIIACLAVVAAGFGVLAAIRIVPGSPFLSGVCEQFFPGLIPSTSYVKNLKSNDPDLVCDSLSYLTSRKDPIGVASALPLLQSPDDYVWLNAALYTGACGRREAIPYLIKALRHTAWRADPDSVATLQALTGQTIGNHFSNWQAWWIGQHPGQSFDWTSHLGYAPRLPATRRS